MQKNININELFDTLEMRDFHCVREFVRALTPATRDYEKAVRMWGNIKQATKKRRRTLAKKYHPDKGVAGEKMKEINFAADLIAKVEYKPPRPKIVFRMPSREALEPDTTTYTDNGWPDFMRSL